MYTLPISPFFLLLLLDCYVEKSGCNYTAILFLGNADDARVYMHSGLRKLLTLHSTTAKIACREKKEEERDVDRRNRMMKG